MWKLSTRGEAEADKTSYAQNSTYRTSLEQDFMYWSNFTNSQINIVARKIMIYALKYINKISDD